MQVANERSKAKIEKKQLQLRAQLWPTLKEDQLWRRKVSRGFTTIPRTMPLLLSLMDGLSKNKPVSSAYLDLWCRAFDECFVTLNKPKEMAFYAGFTGQRAEQTWIGRIRLLAELGFINIQPGPSGPLSYALIYNPYQIVRRHREENNPGLNLQTYNALLSRVSEIGAEDLDPVPAHTISK
jgi:hypothetical protein